MTQSLKQKQLSIKKINLDHQNYCGLKIQNQNLIDLNFKVVGMNMDFKLNYLNEAQDSKIQTESKRIIDQILNTKNEFYGHAKERFQTILERFSKY